MSTDLDLIQSGYADFAQGDIEGVLGRFADDMTWTVPPDGDWGGTHKGKDEILAFFMSLGGRYGPFAVVPQEFIVSDGRVVVLGHHEINGDTIPFCHVWSTRDGQAANFVEYVDNAALARHVTG